MTQGVSGFMWLLLGNEFINSLWGVLCIAKGGTNCIIKSMQGNIIHGCKSLFGVQVMHIQEVKDGLCVENPKQRMGFREPRGLLNYIIIDTSKQV